MPAADDNPHRKNLSVTSFIFIVYFWAGGKMVESTLKLPVISIEIERAWVAALLAWALLFFFFWRYRLKTRSAFGHFVGDCLQELQIDYFLRQHSFRHLPEESDLSNRLAVGGVCQHSVEGWGKLWQPLTLQIARIGEHRPDGYIAATPVQRVPVNSGESAQVVRYDLGRWNSFLARLRIGFRAAQKREKFSDLVLPYLLFILAVVSGLFSLY